MRRTAIIASLVCLVGVSSAQASTRGDVRASAAKVRHSVDRHLGRKAGGRRIEKYGIRVHGHVRPATTDELRSYRTRLLSLLAPPPAPGVTAAASQPPTAVLSSAPARAAGGLPACASESGTNYSTGPENTNASGATGRYQEMPMHRQKGGVCYGIDLSPAGQDRCAEKIYAAQGAGAWTGCG
jgi:hypothetical protein